MDSSRLYQKLPFPDSIRLLELTQRGSDHSTCGRLLLSRLGDTPCFAALSYVWGCASSNDPLFQVNGFELKIRQSLAYALDSLLSSGNKSLLWIDQICIDQENDLEREHQVKLMSKIFRQAQRVIFWLGPHEKDTKYAFDLLKVLAVNATDSKIWNEAVQSLNRAGFFSHPSDLFNPAKVSFLALAGLLNRPWFSRVWIIQEVVLASKLEFLCGGSTIEGSILFEVVQMITSIIHDPPMPWLLKPYRHAIKLGQLRAQVAGGIHCSYPHLAQTFSTWNCKEIHDRLNALFGVVFLNDPLSAWFQPKYSITGPELYIRFARDYIKHSGNLDILHFAGCGDSEKFSLSKVNGTFLLQLSPPADDVPSWAPDWRVQSRPLVLLPHPAYHVQSHFAATTSEPDSYLDEECQRLRVRALLVDEITVCGPPYYASFCRGIQITEHEIFGIWYEMMKGHFDSNEFESIFSSTIVMDAKVTLTERSAMNVHRKDIAPGFKHWMKRLMQDAEPFHSDDSDEPSEGAAHFSYVAEEICRNRTMFVTKNGRLGLGSTHVSPGASIYLIHGMKTPFVVHENMYGHTLRGECYVHGLMDQQAQQSHSDIDLSLM
ncbi:HET-domain-containing protein [Fusarium austroafricanum]|uniref:HET-domain-containing protein n=1 Tax=Fusarium austroafricanum TaxID=2364996 RepID=A0A8H4KBE7_9HYPO|nr:HET-domain-containing protein [Fusarium austroafricanum]